MKRKTKILLLIWILVAAILWLISNKSQATEIYGIFEYEVDTETMEATITGTTGNKNEITSIEIPSTIGGYTVTKIGDSAFTFYSVLREVTLPNTITEIGESAFSWDDDIESITLPSNLKTIGNRAFIGTDKLTSINIPNSVTEATGAFYGSGVATVTFESGLETISDYMFENCENLSTVTLPSTITSIGQYAFGECEKLKSIYIPKSLVESKMPFCGSGVETATFEDGIEYLSEDLFAESKYLKNVEIPLTVKTMGEHVFTGCTSLKRINIPKGLEEAVAILSNSGLEEIDFEEGIEEIPGFVFVGCDNLTSVVIPNTVTKIGQCGFSSCANLSTVTLPQSLITIEDSAFYNNANLTSINLPSNLTTIGNYAFRGCTSLKNINIPKTLTEGSFVFWESALENVTFEEGLVKIPQYLFYGCNNLKSITLPNGLTTIGMQSFDSCKNLENIIISNTVLAIKSSAFNECDKLVNLYIPSSVTEIGPQTFKNENFVLIVDKDSYAEQFAKENNISYIYKGSEVVIKDISTCTFENIANQIYKGTEIKPEIIIKDGTKTLTNGVDYTISYKNNINVGTATVSITGKDKYQGTKNITFKITALSISKAAKKSVENKKYTGSLIKPNPTLTYNGKKLVKGTDYTVSWKNNKKVGIATIIITAKGNYAGTTKIAFKIVPKGTSLTKLTKGSKSFTAAWKAQKTETIGYEIQYATNKSFTSGKKTVNVKKNKTTSTTVKKLKAKKKYYVKIRTYKTVNGKKIYSEWSKVKKITTKK